MDTQEVSTFQAMLTAMVVDALKQDDCKVLIHGMIQKYMDNSFDISEFTEDLRDNLISDVTDYVRENATFDIR